MKTHWIFLTFIIFINIAFGQQEKPISTMVADSFELYYNADNFDAIFLRFSPEMQKALSLVNTKNVLSELKQQAGKIIKRAFVKYEQSYALYKTNFEKAIFTLCISVDNNSKINGLFVKPFIEDPLSKPNRNKTRLALPVKEEWTVVWGGDTKALNYHVENEAQKNALDIVITNTIGTTFKTNGKTNKDYYAFGKPLFAPCEGEIVLVVDGIKDNIPGTLNAVYAPGNTVIIKTVNNEFLVFAHFKQHTIVVKEGQKVKQGQYLGQCGNSGNSSEPHVHFHIQNAEDLNTASGVKCYFENILVNGHYKNEYSPIQKDKIKAK